MKIIEINKTSKKERDDENNLVSVYEIKLESGNVYQIKFGAYSDLSEELSDGNKQFEITSCIAGELGESLMMFSIEDVIDDDVEFQEVSWICEELPEIIGSEIIKFKTKTELRKMLKESEEKLVKTLLSIKF